MYNIDIEITPAVSEEIKQEFIKRMDEKYDLVYTDYNDDFDSYAQVFQECIDNKSVDTFYEHCDNNWLDEAITNGANYELNEIKSDILSDSEVEHLHPYIDEWLDDYENKDEIRGMIEERDQSDPVNDMLGRTRMRARVMFHSNYDCLPHNFDMNNTYSYTDYVKDIIDLLHLNPYWVMRSFHRYGINTEGNFPDIRKRNGKEAVCYNDFSKELLNQCNYCLFTFTGWLPLQEMYKNNFREITHITIPKGNYSGLFNDWNGGGSIMSMELIRDLILSVKFHGKTKYDYLSLYVDEVGNKRGYSINEVYGMHHTFWGKELSLKFKKQK